MIENGELPPYPPERNAYEYPPPPISRRWVWAPIAAVAVAVTVGVGLIVGGVIITGKDFPGMIQDDRLVSAITRECDIMTRTVESMPITGTPAEQADAISDQNKAIANMLAAIREVGDDTLRADPPTNTWLDDWDALIAAREAFAEQRRNGYDTDLRIPRDPHGDQIDKRMDEVWLTTPACEVPEALLYPYPDDVAAV